MTDNDKKRIKIKLPPVSYDIVKLAAALTGASVKSFAAQAVMNAALHVTAEIESRSLGSHIDADIHLTEEEAQALLTLVESLEKHDADMDDDVEEAVAEDFEEEADEEEEEKDEDRDEEDKAPEKEDTPKAAEACACYGKEAEPQKSAEEKPEENPAEKPAEEQPEAPATQAKPKAKHGRKRR